MSDRLPWSGLKQTVAPTEEPVTLVEMKEHLRVTFSDEDAYISSLITTARRTVENITLRQLVQATWLYVLPGFPCSDSIELPMPPLRSISSIVYIDLAGDSQTLSTDVYAAITVTEPGLVHLEYGQSWPTTLCRPNAVQITYTAGYNTAALVPEELKTAIKLLAANLYEHREPTIEGTLNKVPFSVTSLITPHRVFKPT